MNISYIISTSKILTNLCAIKQKIRIENTFSSSVYNALVVKKKHEKKKHKWTCFKINGKETVIFKRGSTKFKNYIKQLSAPLKIYADLESLLKRVKGNDRKINKTSYTEKYQKHIPSTFPYKVLCIDEKINKPLLIYRGKMQSMNFLN